LAIEWAADRLMPFTARHIDEVLGATQGPRGYLYDVELPYRRLGRCRMSDAVAAVIGTERTDVALALSVYEARNGKHDTASKLLGPGVDLAVADAPAVVADSTRPG
jgi:hypothetical protein